MSAAVPLPDPTSPASVGRVSVPELAAMVTCAPALTRPGRPTVIALPPGLLKVTTEFKLMSRLWGTPTVGAAFLAEKAEVSPAASVVVAETTGWPATGV